MKKKAQISVCIDKSTENLVNQILKKVMPKANKLASSVHACK